MAQKICRICGDNKDLKSILLEGPELEEKLLVCTNIKINKNDSLPKHICLKCEQNLEFSYRLRKQSEATEERLRKELETSVEETSQIISQENNEFDLLDDSVLDEKVEEFIKINEEETIAATSVLKQFQLQKIYVKDINGEIHDYADDMRTDIVGDIGKDNCSKTLEAVRGEDVIDLISESSSTGNDCVPPTGSEIDIVPSIVDKESMFICLVCGLTCQFRLNYNNHLKAHLACDKIIGIKNKHKCPHCDNSYTHRTSLNRHTRTAHHKLKTYTCPICNDTFAGADIYKNHIISFSKEISSDLNATGLATYTRIKKKPYACTNCNKTFFTTVALLYHQRNHTSLRQFQCDVCLQGFVDLSDLKRHKMIHDSNTSLVCQICHMVFIGKTNFRRHMRTHANKMPFACDLCSQQFATLISLTKHSTKVHGRSVPDDNEEHNISNKLIENCSKESSDTDDASETLGNTQTEEDTISIQNGFENNIISSRIHSLDSVSSEDIRILEVEYNEQNKGSIQNGFSDGASIGSDTISLDGNDSENVKNMSETLNIEHVERNEELIQNDFDNDVCIYGTVYPSDCVDGENLQNVSETLDEESVRNDFNDHILISSRIYTLDSIDGENNLNSTQILHTQQIEQGKASIQNDCDDNVLISSGIHSFNSATSQNVQDFVVIDSSDSDVSVIDITNELEDVQTRITEVSSDEVNFHGRVTRDDLIHK
uniref:Protein krueppel n=1 Tax=Glossina brevipalpis TaxID=37001 RepID=A0A1A9W9A4_9MUSC